MITTTKTKTILAVDDEEELLNELKIVLKDHNYDVVTAKDGVEGLQRSAEIDPDLIILDITMPKMDGLEMLSRLRQDHRTAATPVIMLTASAKTDHMIDAQRFNAADFMLKPFNLDEFLMTVRQKIRR